MFQCISDELMLDGNARQNLATFCQTWEEPEVHRLMELCLDKNMIDKDEVPPPDGGARAPVCGDAGPTSVEPPDKRQPGGAFARPIGSSEACMLGGMAAKWRWRAKRRAAGKSTDSPNMVCGPVQVVWHKFARYWDVEMREVPMAPGRYCMDVEQMLERVDENTIMVVPTFGVTYTGSYEPVLELSEALDKLQEEKGLDIDIHVDGASGAFLAPFCAPDILWDFRVPRVKSISTSGHKFGLAPLGIGWVLWRDVRDLPDDLIFHVTYLGGDMPVFQINFSRPAGQIVAQYYNFVRLGRDGYRNVHDACYLTGKFLAHEISRLGPFEMLCDADPQKGIPSVAWRIREGVDPGYTLYDVADRLRNPTAAGRYPPIPADGLGVRRLGAADPRAPGRQPGHGDAPARRHQARHRALRQAPGHRLDDQGGVRRLQPPVGGAAGAGPGDAPAAVAAAGTLAVQSTRIWRRLKKRGSPTFAGRSVVHGEGVREGEAGERPAAPARSSSAPRRSGATPRLRRPWRH